MLGVNYAGFESGVAQMADGRDIPLLQDTADEDVVGTWAPTYRDVVILDGSNQVVGRYNLTEHNLAVVENYDELTQLLIDAAEAAR